MALNRNDIEMAKWLILQIKTQPTLQNDPEFRYSSRPGRPWELKAISENDLISLEAFVNAVGEHLEHPMSDVMSREWRRLIYAKLLEDPTALHQFTEQALEKFGLESLSRMVAPEIRETIFEQKIANMTPHELSDRLKEHDQLEPLLEFLTDREPEFLEGIFADEKAAVQREGYEEGLDAGRAEGHSEGRDEGYSEGHSEGHSEGREEGHSDGYDEGYETGKKEGYDEGFIAGALPYD